MYLNKKVKEKKEVMSMMMRANIRAILCLELVYVNCLEIRRELLDVW